MPTLPACTDVMRVLSVERSMSPAVTSRAAAMKPDTASATSRTRAHHHSEEAAAAVADEQDANEETEKEPEGSDDAEEQAGSPEDLKVVVSIKGGRATIGMQRPASDPHIESFDEHDLSELTQEALAVVERARAKWEDEPKHPAHAGRGHRGRRGPAAT